MALYDVLKNAEQPLEVYRKAITAEAHRRRQLTSALFELSPICNFTCPFCYARLSPEQMKANGETVLRFDGWKTRIDGVAALGAASITLSGGECMIHPDFERIYRYAYAQGLGINLLSNLSAMTPAILDMLCECPPESITVTVYGASPETYEKVCGSARYFGMVMENLKKLCEKQMPLHLQFTACKDNVADLEAVSAIAKEMNAPFHHMEDYLNYRSCDTEKIEKNAVDKDAYARKAQAMHQQELPEDRKPADDVICTPKTLPVRQKGMPCSGGRSSCAFNYKGLMLPCISFDAIAVETEGRDMADCWRELVAACDEVPVLTECVNCIHKMKCRHCVAYHYNDMKEFGKISPRMCYKCTHPEEAKAIEEQYARDGYLPESVYNNYV